MCDKKKVLHVVGHLGKGGDSTAILNVMNYIEENRINIQFDFLTHNGYDEKLVGDLKKKDINVIVFDGDARIIGPIKYYRLLINLFKNSNYDAVHFHTSFQSIIGIIAAKRSGISVRVCHSHTSDTVRKVNRFEKMIILPICRLLINFFSTKKVCCSRNAGDFLFGRNSSFEVLYNGINIKSIKKIDKIKIDEICKKFEIRKDDIIIGQVGRFDENKNQVFTINMAEYFLKNNSKVKFFLLGSGKTCNTLKKYVKEKHLNNIYFTDVVSDVNNYMCLFDYLLLPSKFGEGLPVTLIEQQIVNSNCVCLVSDIVTREANLGNVKYLKLDYMDEWINIIDNGLYSGKKCDYSKFDINITAKKWLDVYK